ncbi:MBL fold metallo-hydrolase [Stutzerimonas zhaodongensis]|jgi:metallo-beta-lactamase family protein|uniref:MBL fold metallo-hydrolase n=1 Tax=Stutzerimonas zhaodongensis TaxID=1176257 RepID=UPI001F4E5997|nr:MBL fold metallo-hydrolase [Stutzerimonas zhaodongensis]UNG18188.1 MBL fold metallo-hydrolase [Stutzerimonas zhaodongensis]
MDILHHGARDGVTGSCHQLRMNADTSLLVDCGLFQGAEASASGAAGGDRLDIEFDLSGIRALIVTHVHIDHVGRIPYLLAAGFKGPILCSEASARLPPIVLEDAFKLGISRDQVKVEHYLALINSRIIALPYKTWFTLHDDASLHARIRLQRAGHILGSSYVEVDVYDRPAEEKKRIVFSGDLGAPHAPLLPAPKPARRADIVVLESTYGDRNHQSRADRRQRLQAVIENALRDKGTVLIPAFSIGRTQELLCELEDIIHRCTRGDHSSVAPDKDVWPSLPIILDSPLASRFTEAYRQLQPFWDEEAIRRVRSGRRPLAFEQLITIDSHADHQRTVNHLAQTGRSAVVIAGGGMCSGGRIVNYLKAMLGNTRHNVVFVGYQARGTPGAQIQQFGPRGGYVELDGERHDIRAKVHSLGGYSAHADQDGLVRFVTGMREWAGEIRLIHGEAGAKQQLRRVLEGEYQRKGVKVHIHIP